MIDKDLADKITAYLVHCYPDANDLSVDELSRIHGGASRETYALTANWSQGGETVSKPLIFRRDPTTGLIETERDVEFAAYRAFHGSVPVPEPLFLETDPKWLDRPFFVMERILDGQVGSPFAADNYGDHAAAIGESFWRYLGDIAANQDAVLALAGVLPAVAPNECWSRELDYWENEIDRHELEPQPLVRAAIRWLRANPPPPPAQVTVVHGDYRTGNFLHDGAGDILALLDWEMVHLGDPLEDIAWAIDPMWCWFNRDRPGLMISREEAITIWEQASGLTVDNVALHWWELFSQVKGLAIWITAGETYEKSDNKDAVLAFSSLVCTDIHNQVLAEKMPKLLGMEG